MAGPVVGARGRAARPRPAAASHTHQAVHATGQAAATLHQNQPQPFAREYQTEATCVLCIALSNLPATGLQSSIGDKQLHGSGQFLILYQVQLSMISGTQIN